MRIVVCILIIFSLSGCIEIIEWPGQNESSNTLVVEGLITTELKQHSVRLTRSQPVIVDSEPAAVEGANVTISSGSQLFQLTETAPGIYLTDSIQGIVGLTYHLRIELNGVTYEASAPLAALGNLPEPIAITTSSSAPPGMTPRPTMEYTYRSNFGYEEPFLYEILLQSDSQSVSDATYNGMELPNWVKEALAADKYVVKDSSYYLHPNLELPAIFAYGETTYRRFYLPSTIVIERYFALSPEHYAFVRAVLSETEWAGLGPFGYIPGKVVGNISNGALGYFAASEVSEVVQEVP